MESNLENFKTSPFLEYRNFFFQTIILLNFLTIKNKKNKIIC